MAKGNYKPSDAPEATAEVKAENSSPKTTKAESGHPVKPCDPIYTVEEFVKAKDTVFDGEFHQDIIVTAFRLAGIKEATEAEAKKLVKEYAYKEVSRS